MGVNVVFDSSQKDLWTMNSKRLAVFAVSMQWADVVKVVSRETSRSRTRCPGEFGGRCLPQRKWREVPNGEACTFVGVDW